MSGQVNPIHVAAQSSQPPTAKPITNDIAQPTALADPRFARLLSRQAWQALPQAVRQRFSHRVGPGETVAYIGIVEHTRINVIGRCLGQILRLLGSPLPLDAENEGASALVSVTEDRRGAGQFWTRQYSRPKGRFLQVVRSTKRFVGSTGCEEWVTPWLGMSLRIREKDGVLLFESEHYLLKLWNRRLPLPDWLTPGRLRVGHDDLGDGHFRFTLSLTHPIYGRLIDQAILFRDTS